MLRKELESRSNSEVSAGLKFWDLRDRGCDHHDLKEPVLKELAARMSSKYEVALHLGALNSGELILLGALLSGEGMCLRGNLSEIFANDRELQSALIGLKDKFFIYMRKDRRLLTDRYDKVYLFPELLSALKCFLRFEKTGMKRHLKGLLHPCIRASDRRIMNLLLLGGFTPMEWDRAGDFRTLFEEDRIGVAMLHLETHLIPVWILTPESLDLLQRNEPEKLQFKPSTYLSTLIKIVDCLLYRSFSKRNARRVVSACVKKHTRGANDAGSYYLELKSLGLIGESDSRVSVHADFVKLGYQDKVAFLKSRLTIEERNIISLLRKRRFYSALWIISMLMMEHCMEYILTGCQWKGLQREELPREDLPRKELHEKEVSRGLFSQSIQPAKNISEEIFSIVEQQKSYEIYKTALERLLFRGFLLQDFSETYLRINAMEEWFHSNEAVILNTDREILVFSDRITHYALYVLLGFSNLEHFGPMIRLSIDRESIARGVEYVGKVDLFIECLRSCMRGEVNPSLIEQIQGWAASVKRVQVRGCWMIAVDSPQTKLRLYQSRYLQSFLEGETDSSILLRRDVDIDRLRLELRGENIFLNMEEE